MEVHTHPCEHSCGCEHCTHSADVTRRLARISGQVNGIRAMVNEGRSCSELLTQLSSVSSAVTQVAKLVLTEHLEHIVMHEDDTEETLRQLKAAIDQFAKLK